VYWPSLTYSSIEAWSVRHSFAPVRIALRWPSFIMRLTVRSLIPNCVATCLGPRLCTLLNPAATAVIASPSESSRVNVPQLGTRVRRYFCDVDELYVANGDSKTAMVDLQKPMSPAQALFPALASPSPRKLRRCRIVQGLPMVIASGIRAHIFGGAVNLYLAPRIGKPQQAGLIPGNSHVKLTVQAW
jgi:hypothetical protein